MHPAFKKIEEEDGAALWRFDFQFGPNPFFTQKYNFFAAEKDGKVEANISMGGGFGLFSKDMSQEEFNEKFEEFLAKLQGK